jgi:hypothetical protein
MNEKDLISQIINDKMPNIESVREKCINQQLPTKKDRIQNGRLKNLAFVTLCSFIILFIFKVPIIKAGARNLIYQIQRLITINDNQVTLGTRDWINITIPDDLSFSEHDGDIYYSKRYGTIKELESDIHYDFLELQDELPTVNNLISLNLKEDKSGSIIMIFDFYNNAIEESVDSDGIVTYRQSNSIYYKDSDLNRPYRLVMNFSVSPKSAIEETLLQDGVDSYSYLATDFGLTQNEDARQAYTVAEQYLSDNLNVEITIVECTRFTSQDTLKHDVTFCASFIYNNVEYQIEANSLPYLKQLIENMR